MRIFTLKDKQSGEIRWEGFEARGGMIAMIPLEPSIGFPTVFIDWESLIKHAEEDSTIFVSWFEVEDHE